jgi:hypothetical protein
MFQRFFRRAQEAAGLSGPTKGIRSDNANLVGMHIAKTFAEASQTIYRPLLAGFVQCRILVEPGREPNHLAYSVNNKKLAVLEPRHDHMEAVRSKVDCSENFRFFFAGALR